MEAARTGRIDRVRALLEFGADVVASGGGRGQTALMWTVSQEHSDVVEALLRYGANVHARVERQVRPVDQVKDPDAGGRQRKLPRKAADLLRKLGTND